MANGSVTSPLGQPTRGGPIRLSVFLPGSVSVPSGIRLGVLAAICGLVAIGFAGAAATIVVTLLTVPGTPVGLWAAAGLTAVFAVLLAVIVIRLFGAPARLRRMSAVLDGTRLTVHNGLSNVVRSMDLHGAGVAVTTRRDYQRRQRHQVIRPRLLTELVAPNLTGTGRTALLLADNRDEGASPNDPPPRGLPVAELRTLAAILSGSSHSDGQRAAALITTMIG